MGKTTVHPTVATWNSYWPEITVESLASGPLGGARDQGGRATCLAFATSAAHQLARGTPDALSVEWLYWAAKRRDGIVEDGTTPAVMRVALKLDGQPAESVWPYDPLRSHLGAAYAPPALKGAPCFTSATVRGKTTTAAATTALDGGSAVVLVLGVTEGFTRATATGGRVGTLAAAGSVRASHAVVAVGHGVHAADGSAHVVVQNSWGTRWGKDGYGLVAAPYLERHLTSVFHLV